jgi:hypothetical protein
LEVSENAATRLDRQAKSGLGLEAQREAIKPAVAYVRFAAEEGFEIIAEHVEVETGTGADALEKRPQLAAAIERPASANARLSSPSSTDSAATWRSFPASWRRKRRS